MAAGFEDVALAEGVETPEQASRLKAEGFDEVQGYLFGKPMPKADAQALIDERAPIPRRLRA